MYSAYLDQELDIPFESVTSDGEETLIISHTALENIIYNSQEAAIHNICVHHVCLVSEPRHYAFMCSIEDSEGRRVEGIGEALDATLDTQIAQNYPVLMAFKRAFDDAAIKFLRLPGKVYTDQQIMPGDETSVPSATYSAPPLNDDPPDDASQGKRTKSTPVVKKNQAANNTGPTYAAPPLDEETPAPSKDAPASTGSKKKAGTFGAPPLDDNTPEESPAPAGTFSAPPLDADEGSGDEVGNDDGDEFDQTLIRYGKFKNMGYSIREAYAADPSTVHWVAEEMYATGAEGEEEQRDICARYIALMEGGGSK